MINLKEKIKSDLNFALKARDANTVSVLRMLVSAIRNKEISMRQGENVELDDAQILEVIASESKKRRDSIEAFEQGNRQDLADGEKEEIKILQAFLPEQLSDEDLERIVREAAESAGAGAIFGAVMASLMLKVKGKADGNRVSAMVKKVMGEG
jgi:uncharacterized protein